jgi:hypothetical protein
MERSLSSADLRFAAYVVDAALRNFARIGRGGRAELLEQRTSIWNAGGAASGIFLVRILPSVSVAARVQTSDDQGQIFIFVVCVSSLRQQDRVEDALGG